MAKRLLIAAGTAKYDHLPPDLQRDSLTHVVESINAAFCTKLGYERVLQTSSMNPTSRDLEDALDRWFSSSERNPSDWLVVYYTGHGELSNGRLHLLTRDYELGRLPTTSVSTERLGDMVIAAAEGGDKRRVRNCLFILDTCHSGAGAFDLFSRVRTFFDQSGQGIFGVLAAALPLEEAMAGALAKALIAAFDDESIGGSQQQWLEFTQLGTSVAKRLAPHRVLRWVTDTSNDTPMFFRNPRYVAGLPETATVEQIRRAVEAQEAKTFWSPASRGVDLELTDGWYFTGRDRALRELSAWLRNPSDSRTRIVTGRPGSGKSALLAAIVANSDPVLRREMPPFQQRWQQWIPENSVDAAIYAKGKTAAEICNRIAKSSGIDLRYRTLSAALAAMGKNFTFVIDALDEAQEPARIAREVIRPLGALNNVNMLVGTRQEYVDNLGANCIQIRVDDPAYIEHSDIAGYVTARLLRSGEKEAATPYAGQASLAERVSAVVAKSTYPNFLLARMMSEELLATPQPIDTETLEEGKFPESVEDAFKRYLARFGEDESRVCDLLKPLAWAAGAGLPWASIWPVAASKIAKRTYVDDDVRWLLRHAASFVVETVDRGNTVYRLYHQAFADYLRKGEDAANVQSLFTDSLLEATPKLPNGTGHDWRLADKYIRAHLAEHAAACGRLGELLTDPLFLLTADTTHLLAILKKHAHQAPASIVRSYQAIAHQLRTCSLAEGASYLEMAARCNNELELAERAAALVLGQRWTAPWAMWSPDIFTQTLAQGSSDIWVLEPAEWEPGYPVILVGREDGSAEVWDPDSNQMLARWKPQSVRYTSEVALKKCGGGHVLVVAWNTGHLGARNLETDEEALLALGNPGENQITSLCIAVRDGRDVCITANRGRRLTILSLPDLTRVLERPSALPAKAYALKVVQRGATEVLLAGTDSLIEKGRVTERGTLYLCSLQDLSIIEEAGRKDGYVRHIETLVTGEQSLVAVSRNIFGPTEVWDIRRWHRLYEEIRSGERSLLRLRDGALIYVTLSRDTVSAQQLGPGADIDASLVSLRQISHPIPIAGSGPIERAIVDSRWMFFGATGHQVRAFDLGAHLFGNVIRSLVAFPTIAARTLARSASQDSPLFVGDPEGGILALSAASGVVLPSPMAAKQSPLVGLHCDAQSGLLMAADSSGWLYVFNMVTYERLRSYPLGWTVSGFCIARWQDRQVALVGIYQKNAWAVRMWDLQSFSEIDTHHKYSLRHGEEDKEIRCVSAMQIRDQLRIAFASCYSKVMVANFNTEEQSWPMAYDEWLLGTTATNQRVTSMTAGRMDSRFLLAAGTERGDLKIWDFVSGEGLALREAAHRVEISALNFHTLHDQLTLVSAGLDGTLRFWSPQLEEQLSIDIGQSINAIAWTDPTTLAVGTDRGVLAIRFTRN